MIKNQLFYLLLLLLLLVVGLLQPFFVSGFFSFNGGRSCVVCIQILVIHWLMMSYRDSCHSAKANGRQRSFAL